MASHGWSRQKCARPDNYDLIVSVPRARKLIDAGAARGSGKPMAINYGASPDGTRRGRDFGKRFPGRP
jgi:hypothetical protein